MKKNGKKWRSLHETTDKVTQPAASNSDEEKGYICYHFHRENMSAEQGIKENRPKEEKRDFEELPFSSKFAPFMSMPDSTPRYAVKVSDLRPFSETDCICSKCGHLFPIEKIEQMKQLFERINELHDSDVSIWEDEVFLKLYQGLEPIWYRNRSNGSKIFISAELDPENWKKYYPNE